MYDKDWIKNFKGFSKDNPLDIYKLTYFYNDKIAEKHYKYTTSNKNMQSFIVEVRRNQLPHLMGLQHWSNLEVKQPEKQFKKMLDGEWTVEFLKSADNQAFREHRKRIEGVPYLFEMLHQGKCQVKLVSSDIPSAFQRRKANMIFQSDKLKNVYILELREKRPFQEENKVFTPTSLTVYRKNANALKIKALPLNIIKIDIEDVL